MKKFIFPILLFIAQNLLATHNRAGEITYKRIQPFTNTVNGVQVQVYTYSITVTLYTDFGDQTADRCMDTLYFGDGSKAAINRENGNGSVTGCQCVPKCGDILINQPGYNIKKNVYSSIHTYPGPGQYVTYTVDRNRNQNINNIPNSVNTSFYVEALIIANANIGSNTSPVLNNPPVDVANNVNCFYHQPGAYDADGDSISYELISCKGANGTPISGYTQPPVSNNGYYYMNTSGLISWCTPPYIGEYNIAFYVREWRKINGAYQIIGLIERDFQVLVKAGVLSVNQQAEQLNTLKLWPVPFNETLHLSKLGFDGHITEAELYNMNGQLLLSGITNAKDIEFNTAELKPGIYLVQVKIDNVLVCRKVLKS